MAYPMGASRGTQKFRGPQAQHLQLNPWEPFPPKKRPPQTKLPRPRTVRIKRKWETPQLGGGHETATRRWLRTTPSAGNTEFPDFGAILAANTRAATRSSAGRPGGRPRAVGALWRTPSRGASRRKCGNCHEPRRGPEELPGPLALEARGPLPSGPRWPGATKCGHRLAPPATRTKRRRRRRRRGEG
ncbi:unnamed protein product [Prorocentrum cordatum]|uniref:Uncharacterized protein n=1 Tax=Prorocentrum cordatum TaxID=2364126 RepID=A0ABN9V7Q8_9DINO|nr:unnamed protein product [Polarella glacialis]